MRILFYRYNSICEPGIISAFQTLGHEIHEITEEIYKKNITPAEQVDLLGRHLFETSFDFVFSINFYPAISEVCNVFKLPYVCWIVDSPVLSLYTDSIQKPWNRIFLFDKSLYEEFSPKNPTGIFHLPLACDLTHYDSVCRKISEEDRQRFSSEISFVGSLYSEKCPYDQLSLPDYVKGFCDGLIEAQVKIYGYNFLKDCISDELLTEFLRFTPIKEMVPDRSDTDYKAIAASYYLGNKVSERERFYTFLALSQKFSVDLYTRSDTSQLPNLQNKGGAKTLTEMPLIYHLSRINLNITTKPIQTGLPLRIFDILGCGGFCLSNYQLEIPEYFEIGTDLDVYTSLEELEEKAAFYLEHESLRREIAEHGYQTVKQYHTYEIRLQEMLSMIYPAKGAAPTK